MTEKEKGSLNTTPIISNCTAKVLKEKDIIKLFEYFRYNVGTTLDAALSTGILRNSITFYVAHLEQENLLQAIYVRPDRTTGYKAKHYSADPSKWRKVRPVLQADLFNDFSNGKEGD